MKLQIDGLSVAFGRRTVLREVSLDLTAGHTLGLVGESGSGKSTLAKAVIGLVKPVAGDVRLDGALLDRSAIRRIQLISQDPYASLNPRMTVGQAIAEAIDPVRADFARHRQTVERWLETVALDPSAATRHPHSFSGGQRQRIAIARALAVEPEVIIADEITSALDSSVQAEVLNLLADLRERLGLTMLFVSHDLAVVRHVSDEVAVLCQGELVEYSSAAQLYQSPVHPYTQRLLESARRFH